SANLNKTQLHECHGRLNVWLLHGCVSFVTGGALTAPHSWRDLKFPCRAPRYKLLQPMPTKPKSQKNAAKSNAKSLSNSSRNGRPSGKAAEVRVNQYGIPDWRLEQPEFEIVEVTAGAEVRYEIKGKLNTPVPPIRESKYLTKTQHLELYRW